MEKQLDLEQLEHCESCLVPVFRPGTWEGRQLPSGLTMGNARHIVYVHGMRITCCANCRYDKYGAW